MPVLLVVEDNHAMRLLYRSFLSQRGFKVIEASRGDDGLELAPAADLVLLDVMLPGMDGRQVAKRLNEDHPDTPVLMMTALDDKQDRLHGFDMGVDDYIVKPVDLEELEARIRVALRRTGRDGKLRRGALAIDVTRRTAHVGAKPLDLSPLEFDVLTELALHPGKVFSRSELLKKVWGEDYFGVDRTVDVRIAALRRKLDEHEVGHYIETIRGRGYRLVPRQSQNLISRTAEGAR